jgi:putative sterol carrier protein
MRATSHHKDDRFRKDAALSQDAVVQFSIIGVPGHNAYLTINDKQVEITTGQHSGPTVTVQANTPDWLTLINGEGSPEELFLGGKINVTGDLEFVLSLVDVLHIAPPGKYLPDLWRLIFNYFDFHTQSLGKA